MPPETAELPTTTRPLPRLVGLISVSPVRRTPRQSSPRRARAAVLAGVALYLLMQSALNVAIRAEWLPIRDPIFAEKFALLRAHPQFFEPLPDGRGSEIGRGSIGVPRVLAIGSSRTQLGFDAIRIAETVERTAGTRIEAFNFGCPAAGPMTSALYLRRLIAEGVKPEFAAVEIHPGFATSMDPPYESRWLHAYRLRANEVETLRGFGYAVEPPPQHGWRGWVASGFAYRHALVDRFAPVMLLCPFGLNVGAVMDARGYVAGKDWPPDKKPDQLRRTRNEYAPTFEDYATGGPGVEAIRDMLAVCRANGIRAAVVLMPESGDYRGWYGDEGYRRVGELAARLGREFGVPVADAREWVPDGGFADGHHLTAVGADVFADRLAAEFIGPWVGNVFPPSPLGGEGPGVRGSRIRETGGVDAPATPTPHPAAKRGHPLPQGERERVPHPANEGQTAEGVRP